MRFFAILLALIAFSPMQTLAKGPGGGGHGGGEGGNRSGSIHEGGGDQGGDHQGGDHQGGMRSGEQGDDHQVGVGGRGGVNLDTRVNTGGPVDTRVNTGGPINARVNTGGQGTLPHQAFDAHRRPDFSGGSGEGHDAWRYRWDNGHWWFWGLDNRWMWYGDDGQWLNYGNAYVVQRPIFENFSGGPIKIVNPAKTGATLNYTLDGNAFTIPPGYSQELREDRAWVIQFSRGANLDQAQYGLQSGVYTFARTDHGWELYRSAFPQTVAPQPPQAAPQPPQAAPTNPPVQ